MKDFDYVNSNKHLQNEFSYFNQGNSPSIENESIIIVGKKRFKNRKKRYVYKYAQPTVASYLSKNSQCKKPVLINRRSSMPELNNCTRSAQPRKKSRHGMDKHQKSKRSPFQTNFIINAVSEHPFDKTLIPFSYPRQTTFKIYRCQIGSSDGNCCCSCNSDAMFEVMKSLYDCYKKKNCDNCNCILCGHLQKEDKKGAASIAPSEQMRRAKAEGLLTTLDGKTPDQREKILRGLAMKGIPLPEGKTPSQKKLVDKVRADLGLPPEPENKAIRDKHDKAAKASKLQPLEGKTPAEKEKILKGLHVMGIPLPVGRTPSEKALIAKVMAGSRPPSKAGSAVIAPSEQLRKAKAEGLLTTLKGKTPDEREKILRGLAMKGIPLPEGQSPSEKKLINKVRTDLGLPIEPKNKANRDKHDKAAKAGLLYPLEGKTPKQKEKLLRGQHKMGIPLPVGRTPSEKALIAKIMAGSRSPSKAGSAVIAPSEQLRKAKAEGLLTTLDGKTPDQREKILRGLAMKGIPLPEGQTPSQKKLVDKVRADLGLPIEPKNKAIRDKHDKAAKAGFLYPLEGKTPKQKEKLLRGLHKMGIPLPVGRTPSEKSLIAKVMAGSRPPSKAGSAVIAPSEQLRKAKAEGLLTTLDGKTPDQREKILRGLAMKGIPLPEGQTPSQKKLVDKVRADLGLPIEPKNKAIRDKHDKAAKAGFLYPLEGKTPKQKEKLLRGLHKMGIPLPVGRTPSEKSLIAKVMAGSRPPSKAGSAVLAPSEQLRKAKAEGLLTTLDGKTPDQREKILKGLAMKGLPLPEGKTPSQKKLIDKVRDDLGLPPEPKSKSIRDKHDKAAKAGLLQPLEGKTPAEKEKILKGLHNTGIPLPEGRTPSEKSLIGKIKASPRAPSMTGSAALAPSEQMRRAKAEGLLTPLEGKTPDQREKILRGLAMKGIPLPEGKTPSQKKLINKVRTDLGVPVEPKTKDIRDKHEKAAKAGLLLPLEGKTPKQKEKLLQGLHNMGIPLPVGRTPSEKSLIARVMASPRVPSKAGSAVLAPSEQLRKAKAEGLLTPLEGKTPEQREKILKGLAMKGLPLPEGKTPSQKKLIDKVREDLGLPPEPKSKSIRDKHDKAAKAGLLQPLEGKTPAEKEKILKGLHNTGIPLPEGRTPSEKSLIAKIKASPRAPSMTGSAALAPSEQMRRAKAEGLLTPLEGKTPDQREKILRGLAMKGIPLPEGKTPSQKKLINKVRTDLGVPVEPKNKAIRDKHEKAAKVGLLLPLEGKTPKQKEKLLHGQHNMGIPLPVGRTPSEKSLIARVMASPRVPSKAASALLAPSEQMRRAKAEGLLTPLEGKTPEQREKILKGLAMKNLPLPEGKTPSQKKLIDKVRADLGLPPEPKSKSIRDKHDKAARAGLLQPLEGKTPAQKEKTLKGLHDLGIPLPEGRTPSEKSLIAKIKASPRAPSMTGSAALAPSEQMRRAKAEGLLTPLKNKTPEQREKILRALAMRGIPLPEGESPSEKKLINKVRDDLGLPTEPKNKGIRDKHEKAAIAGLLLPLEGKTPKQKENILRGQHKMGIPLPVGRTPSEKSLIARVMASSRPPSQAISGILAPSEHMRRAKAEGLLTPLKGKTPEQKQKIVKGLAMRGLPLPEAQSPSEKALIDKVRADLGLPVEPKNKSIRDKHEKAAVAGLLLPLEGKTPKQKEKILRGQHNLGIPLPEGRTPSEKALIALIKASPRGPSKPASAIFAPSEQLRKAKAEGLLTPLDDKTPEQREKILKGLAMKGLPLPEGKTPSQKKLIDKVRADIGLPPEPKNKSIRDKHDKAARAGLLQPLEGKTPAEKEKTLTGLHNLGIPLPEGRTPSEKALIAKIKASPRAPSMTGSAALAPSEQMRRAKAEGLLTPLEGKTPDEREKILRGLAMKGIPLPEGKTPSQKKLINKVRTDLGVPVEPKTKDIRDKHEKAAKVGLLLPLEGKTPKQKEKILRGQHNMGIPLPEGRTPSEKSLIAKIKASPRAPSMIGSAALAPSEQMRRAKAEGLLTPLEGKTPEEREKILRGLGMKGIPLPVGQTPSEKKLIDKVRADLGLPPEPKSKSIRDKHEKAAAAGGLLPLEGKTPAEKEKILKGLHELGIPLPEGRTPSEKSLIAKIKASPRSPSKAGSAVLAPSEQLRRAKAEGLLTPLEGKTPEEREKILRGLGMKGIPLPVGQTPSEKKLIDKVRADLGLPPEPKSKSIRDKHDKAAAAGGLLPLEGKTPAEKEKILKGLHELGIPLPEGRTPSEKSLIAKIKASPRAPSKAGSAVLAPSEQLRKAKAEGLLTPLEGKTPEQREKILKGLAMKGLPLPEGKTPSQKKLIDKVRADLGLPPEPKSKSIRDKHDKAARAGLLRPLEGKTPAQKEKTLKGLHDLGIPLPEGRTPSEKSLIAKIKASPRAPSMIGSAALAPSEQMRRAKAEGLLTPLEGKTPEEKEKILRGLAMKGIPLPVGQTPSEKKLIDKVRADLGLPPEPKSKSIRDKHDKAAAAGGLLPLEGKTPAEKEKILKGLHELGIPLPEGRTPSEKSLIAKVMASPVGKKVSVSASKKGVGIDAQEYEDITKTTVCDRGCGCDKKRIRFKHSYVKIKVTSPDLSSICDCDYECLPGIKNGAFIDSEGIKVTVGSAVGSPSYTTTVNNYITVQEINGDEHNEHKSFKYSAYRVSSLESGPFSNYTPKNSSSVGSFSTRPCSSESEDICLQNSTPPYEGRTRKSDRIVKNFNRHRPLCDIYKDLTSKTRSAASSLDSIIVIKSEMSLCYTSTNDSRDTISLMSVADSSITSSSAHYSGYQSTEDLSNSSLDGPTTRYDAVDLSNAIKKRKLPRNIRTVIPQSEFTIMRMSQIKLNFRNKNRTNEFPSTQAEDPVVLFNHLPSKLDVSKIIDKIKSNKRFLAASSIFIVIPASDDSAACSSVCDHSTCRIESSDTHINILRDASQVVSTPAISTSSVSSHDPQVCGKGKKFYMKEVLSNDTESIFQSKPVEVFQHIDMTRDKFCQISALSQKKQIVTLKKADEGVGTDTNADQAAPPDNCSTYFVSSSSISEDHYPKKTVFGRNIVHFLPDKRFGWLSLPNLHMIHMPSMESLCTTKATINRSKISGLSYLLEASAAPSVSVVLPYNMPSGSTFGDVGCKLFRHKTGPFPIEHMLSSNSSVETRAIPARLAPLDADCTLDQGPICHSPQKQMPTTNTSVLSINNATIPVPEDIIPSVSQKKLALTHEPTSLTNISLEDTCCCKSPENNDNERSDDWKMSDELFSSSFCKVPDRHPPSTEPSDYMKPVSYTSVVPPCDYYDASRLLKKKLERVSNQQNSGELVGCNCCEIPDRPSLSTRPSEYSNLIALNDYYDTGPLGNNEIEQINNWQNSGVPLASKYQAPETSEVIHAPTCPNYVPPKEPCRCKTGRLENNYDERADEWQTSSKLLDCTCDQLPDRPSVSARLSEYSNSIAPNGYYDTGPRGNNEIKRNNNWQNSASKYQAPGTSALIRAPTCPYRVPPKEPCRCKTGRLENNYDERADEWSTSSKLLDCTCDQLPDRPSLTARLSEYSNSIAPNGYYDTGPRGNNEIKRNNNWQNSGVPLASKYQAPRTSELIRAPTCPYRVPPKEPCRCKTGRLENNYDERADEWQTSSKLLDCTCDQLPDRPSVSARLSEYSNSIAPNGYYDTGPRGNNEIKGNNNWQNSGVPLASKYQAPRTSELIRAPTCPYRVPPKEPCRCKTGRLENNYDERADEWQTSSKLLDCTCDQLPDRPSLTARLSEYSNSIAPNGYYDTGPRGNNEIKRNNNWQNSGVPFASKYQAPRTSEIIHAPTCPNRVPPKEPCRCKTGCLKNNYDEWADEWQTSSEPFARKYQEERTPATDTSAVTHAPTCPSYIPPKESCRCILGNEDYDESTTYWHEPRELFASGYQATRTSALIHAPTCPYFIPPKEPCFCDTCRLENDDDDERADEWSTSSELLGYSCTKISECTFSVSDQSYVSLAKCYHPDRLGHDMHCIPPACKYKKCPCSLDDAKSSRPCHVPLDNCYHPDRLGYDMHYLLPDLETCPKIECPECPRQLSVKSTPNDCRNTPAKTADELVRLFRPPMREVVCSMPDDAKSSRPCHVPLDNCYHPDRLGYDMHYLLPDLETCPKIKCPECPRQLSVKSTPNDCRNILAKADILRSCTTEPRSAQYADNQEVTDCSYKKTTRVSEKIPNQSCGDSLLQAGPKNKSPHSEKFKFRANDVINLLAEKDCDRMEPSQRQARLPLDESEFCACEEPCLLQNTCEELDNNNIEEYNIQDTCCNTIDNTATSPTCSDTLLYDSANSDCPCQTFYEPLKDTNEVKREYSKTRRKLSKFCSTFTKLFRKAQKPKKEAKRVVQSMPDTQGHQQQEAQPHPSCLENMPQPHPNSCLENMPPPQPCSCPENMPPPQPCSCPENMPPPQPCSCPENMPPPQPCSCPENVPPPQPCSCPENVPPPQPCSCPENVPPPQPCSCPENVPQPNVPELKQLAQPLPISNKNVPELKQLAQPHPVSNKNVPQLKQLTQPHPVSNKNVPDLQQLAQPHPVSNKNVPDLQQLAQPHPVSNKNVPELKQLAQPHPVSNKNVPELQQLAQPHPVSNKNVPELQQLAQSHLTSNENVPKLQELAQSHLTSNENVPELQQLAQQHPVSNKNVPELQQLAQSHLTSNENVPELQQLAQQHPVSNKNVPELKQLAQPHVISNKNVPELQQLAQSHLISNESVPEPQQQQLTSDTKEVKIPPVNPNLPYVNDRGYPYQHACGWIDVKKLMKFKSDLSAITSGFKVCKTGTWIEPEPFVELSFEDAVKYYAGQNLDQFRDLLSSLPPRESELDIYKTKKGKKLLKKKRAKEQKIKEKEKKAKKNAKKTVNALPKFEEKVIQLPEYEYSPCRCRGVCEVPPVPIAKEEATTSKNYITEELQQLYPKGMKLRLVGKRLQKSALPKSDGMLNSKKN